MASTTPPASSPLGLAPKATALSALVQGALVAAVAIYPRAEFLAFVQAWLTGEDRTEESAKLAVEQAQAVFRDAPTLRDQFAAKTAVMAAGAAMWLARLGAAPVLVEPRRLGLAVQEVIGWSYLTHELVQRTEDTLPGWPADRLVDTDPDAERKLPDGPPAAPSAPTPPPTVEQRADAIIDEAAGKVSGA